MGLIVKKSELKAKLFILAKEKESSFTNLLTQRCFIEVDESVELK